MKIKTIRYTLYFIFIALFTSVLPAQAGCTKTIQHRKYDARGKLTGFTYERVYSSDCSFYGSTKPTRSPNRRK
jgi:hypothetical protein